MDGKGVENPPRHGSHASLTHGTAVPATRHDPAKHRGADWFSCLLHIESQIGHRWSLGEWWCPPAPCGPLSLQAHVGVTSLVLVDEAPSP